MKIAYFPLMFSLSALTTGCGTMNSDFSCNATAGDSCLTIEQVDAMTRFADEGPSRDARHQKMGIQKEARAKEHPSALAPSSAQTSNNQPIWVAPWKDKAGRVHKEALWINKKPANLAKA